MKISSILGVAATAIVWGALPALAQVQFFPELAAGVEYSDNLNYTDPGTGSDTAYRLTAELPVTRSWPTGGIQFRYRASTYRYRDITTLDRTDHSVTFGVQSDFSRKSSVTFDTSFSRSQSQANLVSDPDPDIILTERTDRDHLSADIEFDFQIDPRWSWNVGAGVGSVRHEAISGSMGGGLTVEDRDYARVSAGISHNVSTKTDVGFNLWFQENRLEASGDEDVSNAGLFMSRQVDEKNALRFEIGAFSAESASAGDRSGVSFRFDHTRDFRSVALRTSIGYRPTSGGNLPGTSTNANISLLISGLNSVVWRWRVSGQFTRREPVDSVNFPEIDSRGFGGRLTWVAQPKVGVRLGATMVKQSESCTLPCTPMADTDIFRATLGVVWFPKGQPRGNQG